jgi:hypothetical protein
MLAILVAILMVHWVDAFAQLYFASLAVLACLLLSGVAKDIKGLRVITGLQGADRLAIWIVLVTLGVIGYLHNANTWTDDGRFNRPQDLAFWKTELILSISLAAPLVHWMTGILFPAVVLMDGRRFATEFALYVNFSGIALVLWTGEAAISMSTLGSALALVVLAELTLYASQ